ncbi:MAG TPA: hypothetical protein VEF04_14925 [Blastocatellia bacterium]|nr:hypothetical protein [Blastocatellia bacterium]
MRWRKIIFVCLLLPTIAIGFAQDGGTSSRVEFKEGKSSVRIKGQVDMLNPRSYIIPVKAGQRIRARLKGSGAFVNLFLPGRDTILGTKDTTRLDEIAQETGDYEVIVKCLETRYISYQLNLEVR